MCGTSSSAVTATTMRTTTATMMMLLLMLLRIPTTAAANIVASVSVSVSLVIVVIVVAALVVVVAGPTAAPAPAAATAAAAAAAAPSHKCKRVGGVGEVHHVELPARNGFQACCAKKKHAANKQRNSFIGEQYKQTKRGEKTRKGHFAFAPHQMNFAFAPTLNERDDISISGPTPNEITAPARSCSGHTHARV